MIRSFLSRVPMYMSWPVCPASAKLIKNTASFFMTDSSVLWKDDVDVAPIVRRRGALIGPVRRIIQVVGHLRRPSTTQVAIKQIALDGLAKASRAAGNVDLPAAREVHRATHWIINLSFASP